MSGRESTEDKRVMQNQLGFAKSQSIRFLFFVTKIKGLEFFQDFIEHVPNESFEETTSELYDEFIKHDHEFIKHGNHELDLNFVKQQGGIPQDNENEGD